MIAANSPKQIQTSAFRSNSNSTSPIVLTISIIGVIEQSNLSTISINLPQYQFTIGSNITCSFGDSSIPCNVLGSSNNTIIINYPCTSSICNILSFNISINGISNLYSDQSPITVNILSSGYLSQQSTSVVSPTISSTSLNNVQISLSNHEVANGNLVSVSFSSKLEISPDSLISIKIDDLVFSKNMDCSYQISGVPYTGCNYKISKNGYI